MSDLINTEEIGRRLKHQPILSKFLIEVLDVPPAKKDRRAMLWTEEQFQLICTRFAEHLKKVANEYP